MSQQTEETIERLIDENQQKHELDRAIEVLLSYGRHKEFHTRIHVQKKVLFITKSHFLYARPSELPSGQYNSRLFKYKHHCETPDLAGLLHRIGEYVLFKPEKPCVRTAGVMEMFLKACSEFEEVVFLKDKIAGNPIFEETPKMCMQADLGIRASSPLDEFRVFDRKLLLTIFSALPPCQPVTLEMCKDQNQGLLISYNDTVIYVMPLSRPNMKIDINDF
jgi:hypothetical protein